MACELLSCSSRVLFADKPSRFLLASLHVDSLVSKKTTTRLKSALDNLSHGSGALGDAYDKAIDRINGQVHDDCTLAKNVISWISYAQRPLTTEELRHALAVETGDEDFDPENTTDVEDILSVCAGLVTVDEESQVIRLVHYTTQEYLEGIRKDWHPRAQHKIANTCLTYLCFKPFRNGPCSNDDEHESRRKVYSFLDYSARYWPEHLAAVQKEACELAFNLLQDSNLVASALLHERGRYDSYTPRHVTGLHLTAAFGLQHLSKELLSWAKKEKMQLINSKDNTGATPLLWGVQNGRKNIVELLLGTNAVDVDGRNMFRQTPLQCAADHGYKEIVQMLLGTGKVNVNLHGLDGWTALLLAVKRGHKEIVQLLLGTKSVDVNGRNMLGQTPLLCAVRFRHKEIVELLLDTGNVDVNAKDEDEWAALPLAVERGQKEIVELLLGTEKVDVNVKGKDGWTALLLAVKKGHKEIVELLLSTGEVDIDSEVVAYTPLMLAVREGHKEIVEVLLGPGKTDIDKTPARTAPLMYTIDNGYEDLFEFLLGISSSPSKMGDDNPLEALLTANKHRRLAELLLGAGADVHAKDKENSMALMLAGKKGSVNIANLLRSHMSLS
jgi:ankyrin repeat protein